MTRPFERTPHERRPACRPHAVRAGLWLAALAAGCTEENGDGEPTFAGEVAQIVYSSCTPCHRPGGPTPFSLLGYEDVRERGDQIVEVTGERLMPPWLPTHGDFVGDRRLSEQQIALLRRWVEAGAPRGDAAAEPPCPEFASGWQLGEPDLVIAVPQEVTVPASGPDLVRNYVIPTAAREARFVEAVEIRPDSPAVHHAVLVVDETPGSRRRDALDPEPGFSGMDFGTAKPPDGYFLGWTPGKQPRRSPQGMSWRLPSGADFVLQLHLTPTGRTETLRPRIGLHFTDVPPTVVSYPLCMSSVDIDLPPGAEDVAVRDHFVLPVPVSVHSIYPHAHYLCRRMGAWAVLPGGGRCDLFRIDRWDFDWQDDYRFREPLELPAGTRLEFEYRYDNSADNPANPFRPPRRVRLGPESTDEMGNLTLQVTTADHEARRVLGEAGIRRDLEKRGYDAVLLLELAGLLRETGRHEEALRAVLAVREREPDHAGALCELGTCLVAAGRPEEAEAAYRDCLLRDPARNVARVQLANLLLRSGRVEPAIELYEQALVLDPELASLHNNLATACMAVGRLDRAELHYQRTIALDATFFQAWFNLGRVLAATGRPQEARDALLRAQRLRPDDARTREALRQLGF